MTHVTNVPGVEPVGIFQLLENSPYPLAVCNQEGLILHTSQALCAQAGKSSDALIQTSIQTALPALGAPQMMGQVDKTEWLYGWLRPLADPSMEQQQQRLQVQNRAFRLALEQVGMYVFLYRIEQDELRLLTPIAGVQVDERIWKGGPELIANFIQATEEDALFLADAFANAAFGRTATLDLEYRLAPEEQWLRITLSPIVRDTGMIGTLVGTLQNITKLKIAEQHVNRNAAFHNNVLSGISSGWELDLKNNTWAHIWNGETVLDFLGTAKMYYSDYDKFFNESMKSLVHEEDWESYTSVMERGALLARFRRGEHTCSAEYRIRSRLAENAPYEWRNVTARLSRDPITLRPKASCHVTDISPQKANELEAQREKLAMEDAARDARRANARKSQFLADTSRTLHAPLRAMVGISELALMEEMSDTAREYLQQIHDFGNDLAQLLSTVLAQTDNGSQPGISTKEEYSPLNLLRELKTLSETRSDTKAVLNFTFEGQVPSRLYGDEMRLQQALLNLILSTMQVTSETMLTLSCTGIDDENVMVRFVVTDPVTVLSDAQLDSLFVAFAQLGSRYGGGTGLGLSLARQTIRLMDGELTAETIPEGGVCFILTVPQRVIDPRPLEAI